MKRFIVSACVIWLILVSAAICAAGENFEKERRYAMDQAMAGNDSEHRRIMRSLCERGDVQSQILFGTYLMYRGEHKEAERWLKAAASTGNDVAQLRLSQYYLVRQPPDQAEAKRWLNRSATQGNKEAKVLLGIRQPRVINGRFNVADVLESTIPVLQSKLSGMTQPVLNCYKHDRSTFEPAITRAFHECKEKVVRAHGEWAPIEKDALVGREFVGCVNNQILSEKNLTLPQLYECLKQNASSQ